MCDTAVAKTGSDCELVKVNFFAEIEVWSKTLVLIFFCKPSQS